MEEQGFLQEILNNPQEETVRLVYADWLEDRGDPRATFLRLDLALRSCSPDHAQRRDAEEELSCLRKEIEQAWLDKIELRGTGDSSQFYPSCKCLEASYSDEPWQELEFHIENQDTECDAWKQLLDNIEEAAADGREDFVPLNNMPLSGRRQIVTLPASIARLEKVKRLLLYGSHLTRIPPEIGEMSSLEYFDPYTSYALHWFPYEITRCQKLKDSRVSTRALYGNPKYHPPFPRLRPGDPLVRGKPEPKTLPLQRGADLIRECSVCRKPYEDRRLHRVWILTWVGTDELPLLVNACSEECIDGLPCRDEKKKPHRGGLAHDWATERE